MQTTEFNTQRQCVAKCIELNFTPAEIFRTCAKLERLTGEKSPIPSPTEAARIKIEGIFCDLMAADIVEPEDLAAFKRAFNSRTGQLKAKAPSRHDDELAHIFHRGMMLHNNPFKVGVGAMMCTQFFSTTRSAALMDRLIADGRGLIPTDLDPDANQLKTIFPEDFPA